MKLSIELNSVLANLPVYQPGRPIEEVARELGIPAPQIIKLASNENPLGPSPLAINAIKKATKQMHLYPDGNAFYFKQKLAAKLKVNPENLILGNGSNELLEFLGHALIGPGVDVVASQYSFAVYPIVTALLGGNFISVPAKNYGHDLPAMLKAITPKTRIVFLTDPNNPTGTHVSNEALLDFVKQLPSHVLLAIDQAYFEFLENPVDLIPFILNGEKPNMILMRTFSKIYGLAGLRLGYGISSPEVVSALEKIRQPFNVNILAQTGGLAALDDEAHITKSRETNKAGMKFFEDSLKKMNVEFVPSSGNFILVRVGKGAEVFNAMQRLGVIVRPMGGYSLPEWVRITIGTPKENKRCISALKKSLALK